MVIKKSEVITREEHKIDLIDHETKVYETETSTS